MVEVNEKQTMIPIFMDDDSCIICDSISGGADSTAGMPNELSLQYEQPGKKTLRGRYKLDVNSLYEFDPDIFDDPETIEINLKKLTHENILLLKENTRLLTENETLSEVIDGYQTGRISDK